LRGSSRLHALARAAPLALWLWLWLTASAAAADPPLEVTDEGGARRRLELQAGETALIVHFWASWCPECEKELPAVTRLAGRCAGAVNIVAVNVGESLAAAEAFRLRHGLDLPLLRDPDGRLWRRYARGLPANLIRTRDSESVVTGPYTDAQWEERLRELGCRHTRPE
jgi:thiol-disulfide isomerase/thioredoxin